MHWGGGMLFLNALVCIYFNSPITEYVPTSLVAPLDEFESIQRH